MFYFLLSQVFASDIDEITCDVPVMATTQRAVQPSDELDERNSMTVRLEQTERIFQEAQV